MKGVNMYYKKQLGNRGEDEATKYLTTNGYKIIERNFMCRQGEIDIIAKDIRKNEYVFIEVKTRTNFNYGKPVDAVNIEKQKHIAYATKYYIYKKHLENKFIRFDVIEIYKKDKLYIKHLKNCEITII